MFRAARRSPQRHLHPWAWLFGISCALLPVVAHAERGFALGQYRSAEPGSTWFTADSLDVRGNNRWALGAVLDWAYRPLVTRDLVSNRDVALIENQELVHVGAAVNLFGQLRLSVQLPVLILQHGERAGLASGTQLPESAPALGDLRFGADATVFGSSGDPLVLAVGAQLFLPTGSRASYTSDESLRVAPHLSVSGVSDTLEYAIRCGISVREDATQTGRGLAIDAEVGAAFGGTFFDGALLVGPEIWSTIPTTSLANSAFARERPALEGLIGAHVRTATLNIGLGIAHGFTDAPGTPAVRLLTAVQWIGPTKHSFRDRDDDGIADHQDACPSVAGDPDALALGCPAPPRDGDHDGVADREDACLDLPGFPSADAVANGCPRDTDGDAVSDAEDACPLRPGIASRAPALHGCPADRDGDGIADLEDACRELPGLASADPEENGCLHGDEAEADSEAAEPCGESSALAVREQSGKQCPQVQITHERVMILDRIDFAANAAELASTSELVLAAVRDALVQNPQLEHVRVEGHTDNRGLGYRNLRLSRERAQAVVEWLVAHGVPAERLSAVGYGATRPVDSNDTDGGRRNNRRVEFHVLETATIARAR